MLVGWLGCLQSGSFVSRHKRWRPENLSFSWWTLHKNLQIAGTTTVVLGFAFAVVSAGGKFLVTSIHTILGYIMMVLVLAQVCIAAYRPHKDDPKRARFEAIHKTIAYSMLGLAFVNSSLGFIKLAKMSSGRVSKYVLNDFLSWIIVIGHWLRGLNYYDGCGVCCFEDNNSFNSHTLLYPKPSLHCKTLFRLSHDPCFSH